MDEPKTLQEALVYFGDPERAFQFAVELRWPDSKVTCPRCGSEKNCFIKGYQRWFCYPCNRQFTLKVGTIFEDSALGMDKWMAAFWMICNSKNGISSWELHRSIGVTQKTAWFMLHRIREALKDDASFQFGGSDGGPVESDETFIGPNPQKMHKGRRAKAQAERGKMRRGFVHTDKTVVFGVLDRNLRQVRAQVIPDVKRETLQNAVLNQVARGSRVYTDNFVGYDRLKCDQFVHEVVNHAREYVNGQVHTQGIDNFWSLLKRTLRGTYVAVEPFHLDRYLDEQMFRYNNRATRDNPLNDADRFVLAMSHVLGKRLTYAQLTGKEVDALHHEAAGTGEAELF